MSDSITLAIPFYSGLEYLRRALESLRAQTVPCWRAIVVDDAGPEPAARELVEQLGDARIEYVRNEHNLGLAGNWNRCLELATTDLVTLFHADDELEADYVETVVRAHAEHPGTVAVYTRARVINAAGRRHLSPPDLAKLVTGPRLTHQLVLSGEEGLASLLRGQWLFCPTLCFKRSLLGPDPFDVQWRQVLDLDLLARLLFDGQHLVGVPRTCYRYRRHETSQTAELTKALTRFREEFAVYGEVSARAAAAGWERAATVAARARIVRAHLMYRVMVSLLTLKPSSARECLGLLRERRSAAAPVST
jgi:glycosyltransferase involved in cell wall biosynthesis